MVLALAPHSEPGRAAADEPANQPVKGEVRLEAGMLTVHAENVPLMDLLRAIAKAADVDPKLRGDLSTPVNLSFGPVPLVQGVKRLVGDHTMILIHKVPQDPPSAPRLTAFRVYGPATSAAARAARTAETSLHESIEHDLAGSNPRHRIRAIQSALRLDRDDALRILGKALSEDEDSTVRLQAANALGRIGGEPAVQRLETGLRDQESTVRVEVVRSLGLIGGERAIMALGQVLFSSDDVEMRWTAVQALATQQGAPAVAILNAAARDDDRRVRDAAVEALSRRP